MPKTDRRAVTHCPASSAPSKLWKVSLIATLREEPAIQSLRGHAEALESGLAAVDDARCARDAVYVPEAQALGVLRQVLDAARRVYNRQYARLVLLFPEDRSLVESFFVNVREGGRGEGAEEETAAAGSAGTAAPAAG